MSNQLKLGIFTVVGLFAIVASIFATGSFSLKRTYNVYVNFDNISGLSRKAKVKIAGVDIGVLRGVCLENSKAKLKLSIDKKVALYKNAYARIVSVGIIGTKYIEVVPGSASESVLKEGDFMLSGNVRSMEETLTNIANSVNKAMGNETYGNIMENLAGAIHSLKEILDNIAAQNGQIAKTINNFNRFSTDLVGVSADSKQSLSDTLLSIRDVAAKLDILVSRLYEGEGMIATLISDEQIAKELKETVTSAKETVSTLRDTMLKADKLRLSWDYTGRYNAKDEKLRNDIGITIMPSDNKFYYVGVANVADGKSITDQDEKQNVNRLEALLGFRRKNSEIYGGALRGKAGIGCGYSFFQPIYDSYKKLQIHANAFDFSRKKRGPQIDADIRIGVAKWLYAGVAVEDISHKTAVTPYVKLKIGDRDLAALLGIIGVAAVASK
ncbi:MAG: MlaD family protein [Endomicrobium sp.]|nr:MlaD family protein [Endomicrobium sp.]